MNGETPPAQVFYRFRHAKDRRRPPTRVEHDAFERLRNAVAWLQQNGAPASIEQEATLAIEAHASSLEQRFNAGVSFPEVIEFLKPGRRGGGLHKKPKVDPPMIHLVSDLVEAEDGGSEKT